MPGIRSSWLPAVVALAASASEPRAAEQALARSVARQQESIRAMEQAIAQQLAAVRRQRESALGPAASLEPDRVAPQGCGPLAKPDISPLVQQAARRERLEEALLWAVIERESGFDPCAVSSRGALGLMQLMPETARELGVTDAFDPGENIRAGARYLRELLDRYRGDLSRALGAYNAGPSAVDAAGGVPSFPETVAYVRWILNQLGKKAPVAAEGKEPEGETQNLASPLEQRRVQEDN